MKSFRLTIKGIVMSVMAAGAFACSDSVNNDDDDENDYDYTDLISAYVDDVVVPTYADMKDNAWILFDKVTAYNATQSQENLEAVCEAWLDVRAPWELSEAFLYGPCGENGLNVDPNIDTWPFDEAGLARILEGSDPLTVAAVSGYNETLRGYHTIEYLIFEAGAPKTAQLSARELQYLVAAATVLRNDCIRVWAAWHGMDGIGSKDQGAIDQMKTIDYWDVETKYPTDSYAAIFKGAKNPYTSRFNVVEEIIDGCIDIASEVSGQKIMAPYDDQDVTLVESHYAYNSLVDFENNIISIRNAYYGYRTDKVSGWTTASAEIIDESLAAFVRSQDGGQAIHNQIVSAMDTAIDKIKNGIPYPFTENLNATAQITAAATACTNVEKAFEKIKTLM